MADSRTVDFAFNEGDFKDDTEELSDEEVTTILVKRLRALGFKPFINVQRSKANGGDSHLSMRGVAGKLVATLPKEMRRKTVLESGDIRPILAELMLTEHQASTTEKETINDVEWSSAERMALSNMLLEEQHRIRDETPKQLSEAGYQAEDLADMSDELITGWRSDRRVSKLPVYATGSVITDPTTGKTYTTGAAGADNPAAFDALAAAGAADAAEGITKPQFMTDEDARFLFQTQSSETGFNALIEQEAGMQYQDETGAVRTERNPTPFEVTYQGGRTQRSQVPDAQGRVNTTPEKGAAKRYGISEALQLPFKMKRDEVLEMSNKLDKAGFYEIVGGKPQVKGDPSDRFFKEAWRLLLAKSIENNKPVVDILKEQGAAYDDAMSEGIETRLSDPARIRISADSLGQNLLGRKLSKAEHSALVKQIHGFQREAGKADFKNEGEQVDVDVEARLSDMIHNANPAEAGAHDVADQYDTLTQLLRGPGRGVT